MRYALVFSIASVAGGRGPRLTIAWTWASAFSPEKSSQIFLCERFDCVFARSHAAMATTARSATASRLLSVRQTKSGEDALEIVVPIIFNLNPAAFLAVMNQDSRPEMFLQSVL